MLSLTVYVFALLPQYAEVGNDDGPAAYTLLASVAASQPPVFETLSMVDLLRYQADHLDFCCVSTNVYLDLVLLCICRCVFAVVYPPLCNCLCLLCCISTTVSAAVHLPLCIRCCVSAAVYPPLCISAIVFAVVYLPLCIRPYVSAPCECVS
jgi:hypothetical protein